MGRMYSAAFADVAVSEDADLFELVAPSDAAVIVHGCSITDVDGETSEQGQITIIRGFTTSGSGGSSLTPTPLQHGDAAFGGTVERYNNTLAQDGTGVTLLAEGFNFVGAGFRYTPTPEERIVLSPGQRLVVRLVDAPASARNLSGTLLFEEIGG